MKPIGVLTVLAGLAVALPASPAAAQDVAPTQVEVVNKVTNIPIGDLNFAAYHGTCNASGGDVWVATLSNVVPLGYRFVAETFSMELAIPSATVAKAYIRFWDGVPNHLDDFARQAIPLVSQGSGYDYGVGPVRKVFSANQAVRGTMDANWKLNVVLQSNQQVSAAESTCFFSVMGHLVQVGPAIIVGLGK